MSTPQFIQALSSLFERVAKMNDFLIPPPTLEETTIFHGISEPDINLSDYMGRIFTFANCSHSCYVVSFIYLDRFSRLQPAAAVSSLTVHRLVVSSVMAAVKFMDDVCYNNAFFAKIGGVSLQEMNLMERDFLFGIGFQLNVTPSVFYKYLALLRREMLIQCLPPPLPLHYLVSEELTS